MGDQEVVECVLGGRDSLLLDVGIEELLTTTELSCQAEVVDSVVKRLIIKGKSLFASLFEKLNGNCRLPVVQTSGQPKIQILRCSRSFF